jgi:hypothetical protein
MNNPKSKFAPQRRPFSSDKGSEAPQKIVQMKATPALAYGAAGLEISLGCSYAHEQKARSLRRRLVFRLAEQTRRYSRETNQKLLPRLRRQILKQKALIRVSTVQNKASRESRFSSRGAKLKV